MAHQNRILLVGASRGLGLGLAQVFAAQGWDVVATVRDAGRPGALAGIKGVRVEAVDITVPAQVQALHGRLAQARFEVVFVVAGIADGAHEPVHDVSPETAARVFLTNAHAPLVFAEAFHDLLAPGGTMALMTSRLGSVGGNTDGGWEVYRASKAALNTLARCYALRHAGTGVLLMHPGWVRTDMGGAAAPLDVETSTAGMVRVVTERLGKTECVYLDYRGETVPW